MQGRQDLIECGRVLAGRNLVWGSSGNVSLRVEPDAFLISAGGTSLGGLKYSDVTFCRIGSDDWEGDKRPSMETGLHRSVYQTCGHIAGAVIHSQPFYSTLVACSDMEIKTDCLPEAMAYLECVERVPYFYAGSRELAQATAAVAPACRALILDNHGVVCWGESLKEALLLTETLEFLCRLLVISSSAGVELKFLGEDVVSGFKRHLKGIGR